jgi:hypothetical protein
LPWTFIIDKPKEGKVIGIDLNYDKTALQQNDIVTANVRITFNGEIGSRMVIVDLGIPPGFNVLADDLDKLVGNGIIAKYSVTGRQLTIYIDNLESGKILEFSYKLQAKYPIRAKTPESQVYEYYNPQIRDVAKPTDIVVI